MRSRLLTWKSLWKLWSRASGVQAIMIQHHTASRGCDAGAGAARRWTYFVSNWANMLWNAQMLLARVSGDEAAAAGVRDYLERWRQGRVVCTQGRCGLSFTLLQVCREDNTQAVCPGGPRCAL